MSDFLRLYDQVGQDVVHQQENLPKGQQASDLAAAVGSWEIMDMRQELTETPTLKYHPGSEKEAVRDVRDRARFTATQWYQSPQITHYFYEKRWVVWVFFFYYLRQTHV